MLQKSVPAWFEIPARDFDRAVRFYESLLGATLVRDDMGPMRLAVFPHEKPAPTGAAVKAEGYEPAATGTRRRTPAPRRPAPRDRQRPGGLIPLHEGGR